MMRFLILLAGFTLPALAYAQGTDFIPLLPSLPGITEVSSANSIAPLLSQIYKICIGIAAVLAVLQIMRAGVLYMGGDSITEKKEARGLIGTALAGLLLVLSPVIVFSIINPDILNLNIGGDKLQTTVGSGVADYTPTQTPALNDLGQVSNAKNDVGGATIAPPPTAAGCSATIKNSQILSDSNKDRACCASQTNGYVTCQVQARTQSVNGVASSVEYCGCSIKPNIGSEYEIYYVGAKGASDASLVKTAVEPDKKTEYANLLSNCEKYGGAITYETKSSFHVCAPETQVPTDATKTIKCRTAEVMCSSKK